MMGKTYPTDATLPAAKRADHRQADHRQADHDGLDAAADVMPWLATLLIHASAVLIAILFVWASMDEKPLVDENVIPVIGPVIQNKPLQIHESKTQEKAQSPTDRKSPNKTKVADKQDASPILVDPLVGKTGSLADTKDFFQQKAGGQGDDGIFKPGTESGSARSFVFVIDASGSMIDTLPFVMAELKKSVRSLSEHHTFTVLFYQNDTVIEAVSPGMKAATHTQKELLYNWLDSDSLAPQGLSNPITAIELGLKYKPQVMFLLSDNVTGAGQYTINQRELLAKVKQANTGKTKINTIQFIYPDPLSRITGMKPTLQLMSEQTGGLHKFLSAKDLGL